MAGVLFHGRNWEELQGHPLFFEKSHPEHLCNRQKQHHSDFQCLKGRTCDPTSREMGRYHPPTLRQKIKV